MSFRSAAGDEAISNGRHHGRPNDLAFQIEPGATPVAEFALAVGQGLVWDARSILVADADLKISRWPGRGQAMALVVNNAASRPCRLEAGSRWGGPIGAFDLTRYGNRLLFPRHALAGAGPGVAITRYALVSRPATAGGGADSTMLQAQGDGWLFLSATGRVIERRLAPAAMVTASLLGLVAMTATTDVDDTGGQSPSRDVPVPLVRLTGPGRIWLQSLAYGSAAAPGDPAARAEKVAARPVLDAVR
jgi:uncharacterized protein (AIM24 family)